MNRTRGFTLIETVLYVVLLSVAGTSIALFMVSLADARDGAHDVEEVAAAARAIGNALSYAIEHSAAVLAPADGVSADGLSSSLSLDSQGSNPNISFSVSDGVLYYTLGTNPAEAVSPRSVRITALTYLNAAAPGERDNVRILMTLRAGRAERTYQFSASTRP